MAAVLPDFPPFHINLEPTALGVQWKKWIQRLENLFLAMDVKDTKDKKLFYFIMVVRIKVIYIILYRVKMVLSSNMLK